MEINPKLKKIRAIAGQGYGKEIMVHLLNLHHYEKLADFHKRWRKVDKVLAKYGYKKVGWSVMQNAAVYEPEN